MNIFLYIVLTCFISLIPRHFQIIMNIINMCMYIFYYMKNKRQFHAFLMNIIVFN